MPRLLPSSWFDALVIALHLACYACCALAWDAGLWWIALLLWIPIAWGNHAALTRLHEAVHGTLHPRSRTLNEVHGVAIGVASLIPLNVYRYVHARHHAHLGNPRDPEFWPYSLPSAPRAQRIVYAWTELLLGWPFTSLLYSVRTGLSWGEVPGRLRGRIVAEWALALVVWTTVPVLCARLGVLDLFLVAFVGPSWLTGVAQTLRKFVEHMGLHGETIADMTRTVVYERTPGRVASRSQMHVDHHAAHHRWARIPFLDLPEATARVYEGEHEAHVFPSHLSALLDTLPHLLDPKLGPAWLTR
ncbi:MAG: hypothetical protein Tsb0013_14940 [Phycisphaerales bacterium]